jgi:hypothetical protein
VNYPRYHARLTAVVVLLCAGIIPGRIIANDVHSGQTAAGGASNPAFKSADIEFFERRIRPVLAAHCHRCHGAQKHEAGLRLDSRSMILQGGDTGPAIVPHDPDASLLIDAVRYGEMYQMPPSGQLPAADIALLEEWVRRGAPWPADDAIEAGAKVDAFDLEKRKSSHWAWQPIVEPVIPTRQKGGPAASAIDAFLLAKLDAAGVERAPAADKPALLRRATFALIGLPPTPKEIAAFLADTSPAAFPNIIDQLLASPHFGERWGRHWLDLVRYSETLGHEFDYPITAAWRYRDYVIRALNDDVPFDQFVREHFAGDLLDPPRQHPTEGYNESILATAFWFLGDALHAPVDSRADQAVRIENQIDVMSKAFLGLTVACARCHDHKFDAITTKDYYALAGYLTSSHQQEALLDPGGRITADAGRLRELHEQGRDLWSKMLPRDAAAAGECFARCLLAGRAAHGTESDGQLDAIARTYNVSRPLVDRIVAAADAASQDPGHPLFAWNKLAYPGATDDSFLTRRSAFESAAKQRQDQAAAAARDATVFEDFSGGFKRWYPTGWAFGDGPTRCGDWVGGRGGPELLEAGFAHSGRFGAKLQGVIRSEKFIIEQPYIQYRLAGCDGRVRVVVDGYMMDRFSELLFEGLSFKVDTEGATRWHTQSVAKYVGHRAYIEIVDDGEGFVAVDEIRFADAAAADVPDESITRNVLSQLNVTSSESLAHAYGQVLAQSLHEWRKEKSSAGSELVCWAVFQNLLPDDEGPRAQLAALAREAADINARLSAPEKVVAIADGSGVDEPLQIRGSYKNLGDVVPRRLLEAIAGNAQPPPPHGSGRLELAERMLAPANPFVTRVLVNRVWHHLFGRGLVATVDNFGALGDRPTHPELLDYLAARFRTEGWSIKKLIREIMLTDAYQLAASGCASADDLDGQNLLLHRAHVRRLEGEAIRDALLAVSGQLDVRQFGPSVPIHLTPFMDGRGRPEHSGPLDGDCRRSIYLELRRNFLSPFMAAFDSPPPATAVGRRNVSNVPAQALSLMNDPFVFEQCRLWARRVLEEDHPSPESRVERLYLMAFGRPPSAQEVNAAVDFLADQRAAYGVGDGDIRCWADLCHVLVNVKEFIFLR